MRHPLPAVLPSPPIGTDTIFLSSRMSTSNSPPDVDPIADTGSIDRDAIEFDHSSEGTQAVEANRVIQVQMKDSCGSPTRRTLVEKPRRRGLKKTAEKRSGGGFARRYSVSPVRRKVEKDEQLVEGGEQPGLQNADLFNVQYQVHRSASHGHAYCWRALQTQKR